jgi:hypothetical protein
LEEQDQLVHFQDHQLLTQVVVAEVVEEMVVCLQVLDQEVLAVLAVVELEVQMVQQVQQEVLILVVAVVEQQDKALVEL